MQERLDKIATIIKDTYEYPDKYVRELSSDGFIIDHDTFEQEMQDRGLDFCHFCGLCCDAQDIVRLDNEEIGCINCT